MAQISIDASTADVNSRKSEAGSNRRHQQAHASLIDMGTFSRSLIVPECSSGESFHVIAAGAVKWQQSAIARAFYDIIFLFSI